MAADKRKILELARKLAQKNAKDKALAEYQKLLKLDPKDAKLRLEVGDAHRRWGQVDEAIDTYKRVAEQYMAEGFDARAVAVLKQILNLDPDRLDAYAPLAELYERMGLTAEALAALQTAADGYHRQGKKSEALDLLRRMANADPSNTRSRIKVADLLRQEGKQEDAIAEYLLAAEELERQGDVDATGAAFRRILEIDERNVRALSALAQGLAARAKIAEAIPLAERALQLDDGNAERYEQLASLLERAKQLPEHERVMRRLADLYRSRGDESHARQILERFAGLVELGGSATAEDEFAPAADELKGAGILDGGPDALFGDEFPSQGAPEFSIDFGSELEIGPGASLAGAARNEPLAEATRIVPRAEEELLLEDVHSTKAAITPDWEALLAEASVYLRYGKRDKAIGHLQRVVEANPNHRSALEKLGEAYAESGEHAQAVQIWLRAALRAHEERDSDALRVLRGRIAVLDESAAASLLKDTRAPGAAAASRPAPAARRPEPEPEPDDLMLDDDELLGGDLSLDESDAAPEEPVDDEPEVEIELESDEPDESGLELGSEEPELEAESDAPDVDFDVEEPAEARKAPLDVSAQQQVLDDLEEADFYIQQGLHDEAEAIYRRVLAAAPNHPRAVARLGEIAKARGKGASPAAAKSARPAPETDFDAGGDLTAPEELTSDPDEVEISVDFSDDEIGGEPEPVSAGADLDDLASLDLDDDEPAAEAESDPGVVDGSDTEEFLRPSVEPREPQHVREVAAGGDDDGGFDLAAVLADAFEDDPNGQSGRNARSGNDDGFAAVFQAFKKGVRETLADGDHQAHYDLAIAYKEMGLHEDAIYELRTAMADPNRTAECLHLIGLCAIDSNQAPLAIEHIEQLLALPGLAPDAALAGRFDLGRALEATGDVAGARREWQAVASQNPDFQNVRARLAGLSAPKPDPAEAGGFESFEDVIEGGAAEPSEVAVGGETFDDLMAEANAREAEPEPVLEAEPVVEPEPEPAPARAPKPPPAPPRRKKKISFL